MDHLSHNRLGALLLSAALTVSAHAADKFVLASKDLPAAGLETTSVDITTLGEAKLTMDAGGQSMTGTMYQKESQTATTKVLGPQKLRLVLTDKKTDAKLMLNGANQTPPEEESKLKGLPVIAEWKDDKWKFTQEDGKDLAEDLSESLENDSSVLSDYSESLVIFGTEPHAVGDKWTVDAGKLTSFVGLLKPKGSINVEFTGVEKVDGADAATIKMTFDFTGSSKDGLEAHITGESNSKRLIEAKTNASLKMAGKVSISASPQEGVTMTMNGPIAFDHTSTVKKP